MEEDTAKKIGEEEEEWISADCEEIEEIWISADCKELEKEFQQITVEDLLQAMKFDYSIVKELGKGGFGTVMLCEHNISKELVACKVVSKEKYNPREVDILRYLSPFPGVVGLHDVYEDGNLKCLVMQVCPHGDLWHYRKKGVDLPNESQLAIRFRGLMETLRYCHAKGVVHRDIKLSNILISESKNFVLADFGLATRISNGQSLEGLCGTKPYAAPEMFTGCYTEKVDVWSAGIVLCCLLTGERPFKGETADELYNAIQKQEIDFNDLRWMNVSPHAIDLVARMLTKNQFERPSAEEVLRHSWFDSVSYALERKPSSCSYPINAREGLNLMVEQQPCCYVV